MKKIGVVGTRRRDNPSAYKIVEEKFFETIRQLSRRMGQLQRTEAIGQLADGIVHDFNNILTAIVGNAQSSSGFTAL